MKEAREDLLLFRTFMLLMASYPSCTARISSYTVSRGSSSWLRICRDPARYRIASSVMTLLQSCSIRVRVPVNVMRGGYRKKGGKKTHPKRLNTGPWSLVKASRGGRDLKGCTSAYLTEGPLSEARAHSNRKRTDPLFFFGHAHRFRFSCALPSP